MLNRAAPREGEETQIINLSESRVDGQVHEDMREKQAALKELMQDMTEVAELRLQLAEASDEEVQSIQEQLTQKLREIAAMRTEKRNAAAEPAQRIEVNKERIAGILRWGDVTSDDRGVIEGLETENAQLAALTKQKQQEAEPYTKGSLFKNNDEVAVARTQRDARGNPTGETDPEPGWVVIDASNPESILVRGTKKEKTPNGSMSLPEKRISAATLERWNAA